MRGIEMVFDVGVGIDHSHVPGRSRRGVRLHKES
jgi:hypothetical protein